MSQPSEPEEARKTVNGWPEAVSDGLTLPCSDCGEVPRFDYGVTHEFWVKHVPHPDGLGVVCLPCLDRRCGGVGLAKALTEIQWTGSDHTVVCKPVFRYSYRSGTDHSRADRDSLPDRRVTEGVNCREPAIRDGDDHDNQR